MLKKFFACGVLLVALFVVMAAVQASATELFAPMSFDSAAVLPKGVRNFRVTGFTTEIDNKYDSSGNIEPVGAAFNRPITFGKLISSQPPGVERGQIKGGLKSLDINSGDIAGNANGLVNARLTATVPVMAYGITEKFTLGVAIPVLYSSTHVSTGWSVDPNSQLLWNKANRAFPDKLMALRGQLQNVVNTEISNYGYQPLQDQQLTELSDVTVGAKYQYFKSMRFQAALAPKVIIPTGRAPDVNKVVDINPGDGHASAGLASIVDYMPTSRLTISSGVSYIYQFASIQPLRIPLSADDTLSPDIDPGVNEKIGNIFGAGIGARYHIQELWTLGAGYSYQSKPSDQFLSTRYASERYTWLSSGTDQEMHAGMLGVTYSTIPLFMRKQFTLPLEASLNFTQVLAGRNINQTNLTSFDLASYF